MPVGLGWEDPYPAAASDVAAEAALPGDDGNNKGDEATPASSSPKSSPRASSGGNKSRKSGSGTGTRSDGRKTSTRDPRKSRKSKSSSGSGKKVSSPSASKHHKSHHHQQQQQRPEPLRTAGTAAQDTAAAAADLSAAAAFGASVPEAAEDEVPSPHKGRSSSRKTGSGSSSNKRHPASKSSSSSSRRQSRTPSSPTLPAPPPPPRRSARGEPSSSSSSRPKSSGRTGSRSKRDGHHHRSSSSSNRPRSSPKSGSRKRATPSSSGRKRDPSRSKSSSGRGTSRSAAAATAAGGATAAVAVAVPSAESSGALVSPTGTDNTGITNDTSFGNASRDSFKENEDVEAARKSSGKRSKHRNGSGGGGGSGSGSNGKNRNGKSSRSSSSRGRSRRNKYNAYVSCCGWEWKKSHLLGAAALAIVAAGGAIAALLFTGVISGMGGDKSSADQASDFASITQSPTSGPTELPLSSWGGGGGDDGFGGDMGSEEGTDGIGGDSNTDSGGTSSAPRPTPSPTAKPTISFGPTISPRPTSCTESTDLFKYFDDEGSIVTTSCKKLSLSTESQEVKCRRTVVFGGGEIVHDLCPIMCGDCSRKGDNDDAPEAAEELTDRPTTDRPTAFTLEPTPAPVRVPVPAVPVVAPTAAAVVPTVSAFNPNAPYSGHETFSFYVMGDIPYMYKQDLTLIEQLRDQTNNLNPDEEIFQVHVGDIQNPKRTQCVPSHFDKIAGYFKTYSKLPNLMLPGDNDWNDCPNPDLAWEYWSSNFIPFEQYWSDRSDFPSTVTRQSGQPENFAFVRGGILFLGLNLVGGSINEYVTQSEWDRRVDNDIAWGKYHLERLKVGSADADPRKEDYIRGIVIFGHSPRGRRFNNFLMQQLINVDIPVVYIHGNGHTYEAVQPFISDGWTNYWRIQVDQGFNAPPVKVTVRGTSPEALQLSMNVNGGKVFPGGFIKLDRRGGLYEGAVATDADGNPLISGVGG